MRRIHPLCFRRANRGSASGPGAIDAIAVKHWDDYSAARDEMLLRTPTPFAPWLIVQANNKRIARLNLMSDVLSRIRYTDKDRKLVQPDTNIVFEIRADCITNGRV